MATWKCLICNWDNAEAWTSCAKCGTVKILESDKPLVNQLLEELRRLKIEIENYEIQVSRKWEYSQITSDEIEKYGGLNSLGAQGWELVSATSYSEGGGMTVGGVGSSSYTVKVLYLFKREIVAPAPELEARRQNVMSRVPQKYLSVMKKLEGSP